MDFIPPIIVDIISRSKGFGEGVDKAKADMADLSGAATATAAEADSAIAGADQSIASHSEKIGSNLEGIAGDAAAGLGSIPGHADEAVEGTEKVDKGAEKMAGDVSKHAEKSGAAFKKMASTIGSVASMTGLPLGGLKGKVSEVKEGMEGLGGEAEGAAGSLGGLPSPLLMVGAAGAVVVGVTAELAEKMDAAVVAIEQAGGTTDATAKRIGGAFLGMGGTTESTGQQIAGAFANVAGQLKATGVNIANTKQDLDVMRASTDLAEASGGQLGDSTSALAGIMQAFGIKAAGAGHASDILFNASRATGVSIDTLSGQLEKARSKLGSTAGSIGQLSGLLVDMTEHGVTGRAALAALNSGMGTIVATGTATQAAIANQSAAYAQMSPKLRELADRYRDGKLSSTDFTKAAEDLPPAQTAVGAAFLTASTAAGAADEKLKALHVTVFNAKGNFVGMGSIISQLAPRFAHMTEAQRLSTSSMIFGKAAARQMAEVIAAGAPGYDKATAAVAKTGAAHQAAAEEMRTLGGESHALGAELSDFGTKIGAFVIPALTTLLGAVVSFVDFLADHKAVLYAIAAVIAAFLVPALWSLAAAAVAAALPFLPMIVIVAAVGAAIYELVKHFGIFKRVVEDVFHAVAHVVSEVFDWIKEHWPLLLDILLGPIGFVIGFVIKHFHEITDTVKHVFNDIVNFISGLASTVWKAATSVFNAALHFGEKIVEGIIHALKSLPGLVLKELEKIPVIGGAIKLGGKVLGGIEHGVGAVIHEFAAGGVVAKPTLAMIGEGSEPEAVLPLSQLRQLLSGHQGDFYSSQGAGASTQQQKGGLTIENLNINGRSRTDAQIINDLWLRLRPYLTQPAY